METSHDSASYPLPLPQRQESTGETIKLIAWIGDQSILKDDDSRTKHVIDMCIIW